MKEEEEEKKKRKSEKGAEAEFSARVYRARGERQRREKKIDQSEDKSFNKSSFFSLRLFLFVRVTHFELPLCFLFSLSLFFFSFLFWIFFLSFQDLFLLPVFIPRVDKNIPAQRDFRRRRNDGKKGRA